MNKKNKVVLFMLIFTITCFCGCSTAIDFFSGDDEQVTYEDSNTVFIPIEKIRTLNPAISLDEDTYYISKLVYEGLFVLDENLMPQPQLVSSYTFDADKLSHVINLKKGIRWHDGEDFTAADVKFTIDSLISLSYSGETLYGDYVSNIASVKLDNSDEMKCTIYYKNSSDTALENLIFPILPFSKYKNVAALKKDSKNFKMVGTGPYQYSDYNSLSYLVLKGYQGYYGPIPNNILNFQILPSKTDAINLMDVNNITMLFSREIDRNTTITNKNIDPLSYVSNEAEFIGFNFQNEALAKKKVRQAISSAIDAQAILDAAYYKNGIPCDTLYYPGYFGIKNEGDAYEYSIERALELLTEAGYLDIDADTFVEDPQGNEISIGILVNENDQSRVAAAKLIKGMLDKLPIETHIEYCSWDEYNMRLNAGNYDLYIGGYQFDERYDLRRMLHSNYGNLVRYTNTKLDEFLDEMQLSPMNDEKTQIFQQVKNILIDEIPYYCLFYKTHGVLTADAFRGDLSPMFNNIYVDSQSWSCSYIVETN